MKTDPKKEKKPQEPMKKLPEVKRIPKHSDCRPVTEQEHPQVQR